MKPRFRRSFWDAEWVCILIGSLVTAQNAKISVSCFYWFCKKVVICVMISSFFAFFAFLCIFLMAFEPIKIQTCSASQNDRLNFSFVKDSKACSQKNVGKGPFISLKFWESPISKVFESVFHGFVFFNSSDTLIFNIRNEVNRSINHSEYLLFVEQTVWFWNWQDLGQKSSWEIVVFFKYNEWQFVNIGHNFRK